MGCQRIVYPKGEAQVTTRECLRCGHQACALCYESVGLVWCDTLIPPDSKLCCGGECILPGLPGEELMMRPLKAVLPAVFGANLLEELLFRGVPFFLLGTLYVWVGSAIWVIWHLAEQSKYMKKIYWWTLSKYVPVAIVLSFLWTTASLWPLAIVVHWGFNLVAFLTFRWKHEIP